ncbi:uncharacterized protein STEHIDRAFT_151142 [Stereum hirsutum FP-91666 SS1]|uniref:uncharacterized protein n=1 Tax=Stereum hirsutum (strain FP-91666) TaxID=721885 RepID=UPI000440FD17|nr:uncharacterized protein STEHIDRAFT_151142 [Stereum hirsutum FP-91666 SS1]EIM91782.1 hypothetical protein STEHIDRAFT_151142 [Stereum hirsutum FP-91666 SS1]
MQTESSHAKRAFTMDITRVLPPNVMEEIFRRSFVYPEADPQDYTVTAADILNKPPLSLTQVSRRWRFIAINHPPVWTSLLLPTSPGVNGATAFFVTLQSWLSRSQSLPLSFRIHISSTPPQGISSDVLGRNIGQYLGTLLAESRRWEDVSFSLDILDDTNEVPSLMSTKYEMPRLERLVVRSPNILTSSMCHFVRLAPRLQEVTLHGPSLTNWDLPWSQLTKLDISCDSYKAVPKLGERREHPIFEAEQMMNILRQCTNLEELRFGIPDVNAVDLEPLKDQVTMHSLRSLHASFYDSPDSFFYFWFYSVVAPNLQSLSVHSDQNFLDELLDEEREKIRDSTGLRSAFRDFFTHCKHSLRELTLIGDHGNDENLLSMLAIVPNLSTLTLTMEAVTPSLLRSLTLCFAEGGSGILQSGHALHLRHICFVGNRFCAENKSDLPHRTPSVDPFDAFTEMVESRWRIPGKVLEKGKIERLVEVKLRPEVWERMAKMHGEGYERVGKMWDEGLQIGV